jgi:hypothetical protein
MRPGEAHIASVGGEAQIASVGGWWCWRRTTTVKRWHQANSRAEWARLIEES